MNADLTPTNRDNRLHAALLAHFDEGYDELRGPLIPALRAVLELHAPKDCDGRCNDDHCLECMEIYPCVTVKTIARELGVTTETR